MGSALPNCSHGSHFSLSFAKTVSGMKAFEISNTQQQQTGVASGRSGSNNITWGKKALVEEFSACLQLIDYASARSFDEGQVWNKSGAGVHVRLKNPTLTGLILALKTQNFGISAER
jgi:hypothetical protein